MKGLTKYKIKNKSDIRIHLFKSEKFPNKMENVIFGMQVVHDYVVAVICL